MSCTSKPVRTIEHAMLARIAKKVSSLFEGLTTMIAQAFHCSSNSETRTEVLSRVSRAEVWRQSAPTSAWLKIMGYATEEQRLRAGLVRGSFATLAEFDALLNSPYNGLVA